MAVNENNGDIYVVGQIVGTCFDDPEVGCMGLVGSHLPRRGIANLVSQPCTLVCVLAWCHDECVAVF